MQAILNFCYRKSSPIVYEILHTCHSLFLDGININFVWIPGHAGIKGNEEADQLAKNALYFKNIDINLPLSITEAMSNINSYFRTLWQIEWENSEKGRHYYNLQPSVLSSNIFTSFPRQVHVILFRLLSGHIPLNFHLHRFGLHETGLCNHCLFAEETIDHFLFQCDMFRDEREVYYRNLSSLGVSNPTLESVLNAQANVKQILQATAHFVLKCHRF